MLWALCMFIIAEPWLPDTAEADNLGKEFVALVELLTTAACIPLGSVVARESPSYSSSSSVSSSPADAPEISHRNQISLLIRILI